MTTPTGPQPGGYGTPPPQQPYAGGYATAPAPGQVSEGPYAPPTAGYGHAPAPVGPPPKAANPGTTIGWVGFALAFLVGFVGIVLGAISISRSRRAGASIRIGVVAVVVGTLQVLAIIVGVLVSLILHLTGGMAGDNAGDTDVTRTVAVSDLVPGNCARLDTLAQDTIEISPCVEGHDAEVISHLPFSGTAYPGDSALYDDAVERCYDPVAGAIPPRVDPQNLYVDALVPTQEEWDAGHRTASCLLVSDGDMTGSATAGDLVAPIG